MNLLELIARLDMLVKLKPEYKHATIMDREGGKIEHISWGKCTADNPDEFYIFLSS